MTPPKREPDTTTYAVRLAARLAELRQAAGLSQAELAERLGVRQSTVSLWETAARSPRFDQLPAIANALGGCSVEKFFPEF